TLQLGDGTTDVALSGNVTLANNSNLVFDTKGTQTVPGNIGGTSQVGNVSMIGTGTVILSGTNQYTGTTTVSSGTMQFAKAASLYNNTPGSWTAANLIVATGATAGFNVGGTGEFTSANIATIAALGTATGGFENNSTLGLDTSAASSSVSAVIGN